MPTHRNVELHFGLLPGTEQRVQRRFWHWNQARCIAVLCVNRYKDM